MNNLSPRSKQLFARFKQAVGYSEPYICVCDAVFVKYVQDATGRPVSAVLEEFLGGRVKLFSTMCINICILGLYGAEPNRYQVSRTVPCLHRRDEPEYDSAKCVKGFVNSYLGHRLVVCSTEREDYDFYLSIPGRVLVHPRDGGGLQIAPFPRFSVDPPPPQFEIMEYYIDIHRLRAPLLVLCEPEFVGYVQETADLTSCLEKLLGGRISLVTTTCIQNRLREFNIDTSGYTVQNCGHDGHLTGAECMSRYVKTHPDMAHVVCTMEEERYNGQAKRSFNLVLITHDDHGGIMIASHAVENCNFYVRHCVNVNSMMYAVYVKLRDYLTHRRSISSSTRILNLYRRPVNFMVSSEGCQKIGPFTLYGETTNAMMEISGANLAEEGLDFELSANGMEDNPTVDIFVKKRNSKKQSASDVRKIDDSEADKSAKRQKYQDRPDDNADVPSDKKALATAQTATGTKTVFMWNLSSSIRENNIVGFFKDGVVADVRIASRDEPVIGCAYVEFTTFEAAQEAIKLDGSELLGQPVRVSLYNTERGGASSVSVGVSGSGSGSVSVSTRGSYDGRHFDRGRGRGIDGRGRGHGPSMAKPGTGAFGDV